MDNLSKALMKDLNHKRAALILRQCLLDVGVYTELYHPGNNYLVQGVDWEAKIGFSAGDPDSWIFEVSGCITRDEDPDAVYLLNAESIVYLAGKFFNEDEDDFEDEYDYEDDYYDEDEDEDEDDDEDNRVCQFRPRPQMWQRPQRRGRQADGNSDQYAALEKAGEDLIQGLKDVIGNKYKADENGDPAVFEARRTQILEDVIDILRVSGCLKEVKR